jgi:hypothetical protein
VNDAEELSLKRESVTAEHRAARQILEIGKLIQHELFVPVRHGPQRDTSSPAKTVLLATRFQSWRWPSTTSCAFSGVMR